MTATVAGKRTVRKAIAGEAVIGLDEFFKQVSDTLGPDQLKLLLGAFKLQEATQVQPGDLITSSLLNGLLADIADLKLRLAQLGGVEQPGTGVVQITSPTPSDVLKIGEPLLITGLNFGSKPRVMLEELLITRFDVSTDRMLLVKSIPAVQNIPEAGRSVSLTVASDQGSHAVVSFRLAQPTILKPEGRLEVQRTGPVSNAALVAGTTYTIAYSIRAIASIDEDYDVTATVDKGWPAVVVRSATEPQSPPITSIRIERGQNPTVGTTKLVGVRVTIPAGTADEVVGKLSLTVTSQKNSKLARTSDDTELEVGETPAGPQAIGITPNSVTAPGSLESRPNQKPLILAPPTGRAEDEVDITFVATIPADGRYTVQPLNFSSGGAHWTANVVGPPAAIAMTQPDEHFVVTVKASPGAGAATLRVRLVSDTDATVFGELQQDLAPKPAP